jgi:hypothetical protein
MLPFKSNSTGLDAADATVVIRYARLRLAAGDRSMITVGLRAALAALFVSFCAPNLFTQMQPCPPAQVLIAPSNPAYADAQALAKELRNLRFVIRCIFPSKLGSMFQINDGGTLRSTIEGEAVYLTNSGGIDVVFVPKPQDFSGFAIRETPERSGHMYLLSGTPHVVTNQFGSAHPEYFLKRENELLIVSDKHLRDRLEHILQASRAN